MILDHNTGEPLAFHFGNRKHNNLDELLNSVLGIGKHYYYLRDDEFSIEDSIFSTPTKIMDNIKK